MPTLIVIKEIHPSPFELKSQKLSFDYDIIMTERDVAIMLSAKS